jgi:16S rRNA (uracil1498-N3)-methyltransferase
VHARFYAPDAQHPEQLVALSAEESTHATRVLRLQAGNEVRVFDGHGREFVGTIERSAKHSVEVRLLRSDDAAIERRVKVTLVQAVLKSDKMDDVIRDAVMMGAASIVPLVSARTEISLATLARARRRDRWQRIAVVSAKQCGRAVVPAIEEACDLTTVCSRLAPPASPSSGRAFIFVEPSATDTAGRNHAEIEPGAAATIIIGPEGGWTPEEIEQTAKVAVPITLPGPTLRADAMALVALSVLFTRWGDL